MQTLRVFCLWACAHFKTVCLGDRDLEIRFECLKSARVSTGFPYSKRLFDSVVLGVTHQAGAEG